MQGSLGGGKRKHFWLDSQSLHQHNRAPNLSRMWVSIDSEAACSAALQQTLDEYGIVDTDALQAVLEDNAAGLARALCTALQAAPPAASAAEHVAMIFVMDEALSACRLELEVSDAGLAAAEARLKVLSSKVCETEARLVEARKRTEAAEAKLRAAREAAKTAEKEAARRQHESDRQAAAVAEDRAALVAEKKAVMEKEAEAKRLLADATKRLESAKEVMECHRAGKNKAAADASAAEAAQDQAARDLKAAEAALAKSAYLQGATDRVAVLEAAMAEGMAANAALREEVSALRSGCTALEAVAEAAEDQCAVREADLHAAVAAAEQRALAAEQRAVTAQRSKGAGRGGRGSGPSLSTSHSHPDQGARIAALESKLASVRRAIAQGSHCHKIIMHGRQYTAYDYGEAPKDDAERVEQEGLGYTLVDL